MEFVSLTAEPGDAVFMSAFTIHRTHLTACRGFRMSISWRYEDILEPTYPERNFPYGQERHIARELLLADFPSHQQVLDVFKEKQNQKEKMVV